MSVPDHNDTKSFPVWNEDGLTDVQSLFQNPSFVPEANRTAAGLAWYKCMSDDDFGIFLFDKPGQPNNVFKWGLDIYNHLGPIGDMPKNRPGVFGGKFPPEALEQLRLWYNQGGRVSKADPIPGPNAPKPADQIPPLTPPIPARAFVIPAHPVWDAKDTADDIKMCFQNPCWIENGSLKARFWKERMAHFQFDATTNPSTMFDLQSYEHVKGWARNIYMHIASQAMPIDPPYFSDEAIEAFRLWYDEGCPQFQSDVGVATLPQDPILPGPVDQPFKMRKDINTLTEAELTTYRMGLLRLGTNVVPGSVWQTGGSIHANWCLHYMQASFPWHRAHLLWLENQLGSSIPYWNFFSSKAIDPSSPDSGLPQAFLDDTFVDTGGKTQKNPLRHAFARGGISRASTAATPLWEVKRAQPFEQPDGPTKRADYITDHVPLYLKQVYHATIMSSIGDAQGSGNVFTFTPPDLTPDTADTFYKDHLEEFDGVLEQAHDNLHGWTGPDMANNSYAAFDPLFWSFHANFDRIFETWLRAHPEQEWGSNFPLRPFRGREGTITTIEGDRRTYEYTNIGDMVMDSKALGYVYGPPGNPDYVPPGTNVVREERVVAPIVFFPGVKCTDKTYMVHVALDNGDGKKLDFKDPGKVLFFRSPSYWLLHLWLTICRLHRQHHASRHGPGQRQQSLHQWWSCPPPRGGERDGSDG